MNKLNTKQRLFVELYLTLWNATEAARQAGYSERTAQEQSSRLLSNVIVKQEIEARLAEQKASADEVLQLLTAHMRGNIGDFLSPLGLIDIDKARQAEKLRLVKKLKQHTTRISKNDGEDIEYHDIEIELYDAQSAAEKLGRALGVFNADRSSAPSVTVNNNLAVIGVQPVDYRTGLAALAPGPIRDSDAPGAGEGVGDGAALGEIRVGRDVGAEHA